MPFSEQEGDVIPWLGGDQPRLSHYLSGQGLTAGLQLEHQPPAPSNLP